MSRYTPGPDAHEIYVETRPDQLLPCPFCGGSKVKAIRDSTAYLAPHDHIVLCECGACGPNTTSATSAIEKWNRRVQSLVPKIATQYVCKACGCPIDNLGCGCNPHDA